VTGRVTPAIRVLLAEDEAHLGAILEQFLAARGFVVTRVRDGRAALEALRTDTFDVALLDIVMPEVDGLEVLRQLRRGVLPPEVIVITGNSAVETALAALALGAYDLLAKPYRMAEVEAVVRKAWEKRVLVRDNAMLRAALRGARGAAPGGAAFLTQYAPLRAALSLAAEVAPERAPMLITGPTGSGKAHVARWLHGRSGGDDQPLLELDCATMDPETIDVALFGRDAADAAAVAPAREAADAEARGTAGLLELAGTGTLLLRHVDAMGRPAQAALADALEAHAFRRVGGTRLTPLQARVIATSTRSPEALGPAGAGPGMHPGLLDRLLAVHLALPSLAERAVDIAPLARAVAAHVASERGAPLQVADDAIALLESRAWPGNVRELEQVVTAAAWHAVDGRISARELLRDASGDRPPPIPTLGELERRHIADVLERTGWHQGQAAALLGISPKTLYRKIREYGFRRPGGRRG
jgi:two-component system NtrC family response regulator